MRLKKHPILDVTEKRKIDFYFDGRPMSGKEGDTIAAALHASGIKVLSKSIKDGRNRGLYCAIGNCGSCHMTVDGIPNVKTCITELKDGMVVESQKGLGRLE
ncbi:MAG TPA: (2Fe-2S)-binding protein [Bacillota bacterium]|nr:(2Fe-2S)-binding protein [Bacillota bacterium]HPF42357.1 (2Fe-2S)-binding protein [Bacillota bacterium]HPJ86144.1 (2Fe-2S)-binding protein [Bacillota bacterium]HPQ61396.1 (2Fe-2S)-binding protein [Bacillota bacterium]HRX91640.1 (2Fe-2S)-binding protein [Candidatus Izemoplasmatales bacterium]